MFKIFEPYQNLIYGVSEKSDGPMKPSGNEPSIINNRQNFFKKIGIRGFNSITPAQSHSAAVLKVTDNKETPAADGLITTAKNLLLTITIADCFPVYFFNPRLGIVGLAHCGWRGVAGGLAENIASAMESDTSDAWVGIGPGIQVCHFEVKNDVVEKLSPNADSIEIRGGKTYVNLPKILTRRLLDLGIRQANIESFGECTYCLKNKYFSHRRDNAPRGDRMLACIGLSQKLASQ